VGTVGFVSRYNNVSLCAPLSLSSKVVESGSNTQQNFPPFLP